MLGLVGLIASESDVDPAGSKTWLLVGGLAVLFTLGPTGRPSAGRCKAVVPWFCSCGCALWWCVGAAWGGGRPWFGWARRRAALRVCQAGLVFFPWAIERP